MVDINGVPCKHHKPISSCPYGQNYRTRLHEYSPTHTRFHDYHVIKIFFLFFFSKLRVDFFTKRLQSRRRCAQSSSDRFSLAARLQGKLWRFAQKDIRRRHLLPKHLCTKPCILGNMQGFCWLALSKLHLLTEKKHF